MGSTVEQNHYCAHGNFILLKLYQFSREAYTFSMSNKEIAMEFDLHAGELVLAENLPLAARQACGALIVCTRGVVWITIEGEAGDIFLRTGQSHRIASNGLALFEAIGHGAIRVEAPRRAGRWLRTLIHSGTRLERALDHGFRTA